MIFFKSQTLIFSLPYPKITRVFSLLFSGILLVLVILYSLRTMSSIDSWWHLAEGRYIVEHRSIPETDIFRFKTPAEKTINHEWLSQVLFYTLYNRGGIIALHLLLLCLMLATFLLLLSLSYDSRWYITSPLVLFLALLVVSERLEMRPHIFNFFFASLFLFLLSRYQEQRGKSLLFLLPPLQMIWANLHGGFIIGLLLLGAFVLGEGIAQKFLLSWDTGPVIRGKRYRNLVLVSLCALALSFVNPYSYRLFSRLYLELGDNIFKNSIFEWHAPLSLPHPFFSDVLYYYKIYLGLSLLSFLVHIRRCRLTDLCLYLPLLFLSLLAFRFIALFVLITAPLVIRNINSILHALAGRFPVGRERNFFAAQTSLSVAFLLLMLLTARDTLSDNYYIRNRSLTRFGTGVSTLIYPIAAVDFLQTLHAPERLFHTLDLGGYLMWRLFPRQKVFIDTISVDPLFFQEYNGVMAHPEFWEAYSQKYGIYTVLLTHFWSESKGLLSVLSRSPHWTLVYFDDMATIFLRTDSRTLPLIERFRVDVPARASLLLAQAHDHLRQSKGGFWASVPYPLSLLRLGDFFRTIERPDQAVTAYQLALTVDPALPVVHFLLATIYAEQQRVEEAIQEYKATLRLSNQYPEALYSLAELYRQQGMREAAIMNYTQFMTQWRGNRSVLEEVRTKIAWLQKES